MRDNLEVGVMCEKMVAKDPKIYSEKARGRQRCRLRRGVLKTVIIRGWRFVLTFSDAALKPSV